jgi:hypothetical protein
MMVDMYGDVMHGEHGDTELGENCRSGGVDYVPFQGSSLFCMGARIIHTKQRRT